MNGTIAVKKVGLEASAMPSDCVQQTRIFGVDK